MLNEEVRFAIRQKIGDVIELAESVATLTDTVSEHVDTLAWSVALVRLDSARRSVRGILEFIADRGREPVESRPQRVKGRRVG